MAAVAAHFWRMTEVELRQWVAANPGWVNHHDSKGTGYTPLVTAMSRKRGLLLFLWLLNEEGADVNAITRDGRISITLPPSKFSLSCWTVAGT